MPDATIYVAMAAVFGLPLVAAIGLGRQQGLSIIEMIAALIGALIVTSVPFATLALGHALQ